jgi:hypothetical protein
LETSIPMFSFIVFAVLCLSCRASRRCVSVQASCEDGGWIVKH